MPRARTTGSLEWVGDLDAPKPTDHWRCRVWNRGKRQWLKLPPTVRYDQRVKAEKLAHTMAAASRAGRVPLPTAKPAPGASPEGDVTLDAWGALWFQARAAGGKKSTRPDESKWNTWVVPRLGKLAMATITRTELEAWVEWIDRQVRAQRLAWKTAQLAWGLITSAMQTASAGKVKALRVRNDNPSKDVEPPEGGVAKSKVYLYPSEMLALLACESVPLAVRRAYAVTVYADPRAGEVEALHWEDLDLEHETAHVHRAKDPDDGVIRETKGRAARRFTLEPTLLPLLRAMRAERPLDELVFKPWPLHKNRAGQLRAALVTAGVTRADLFANDLTRKHMTFHDLRATGITWRAIRGDEPLRIMHAAGHKDLATTMVYVREAENVRTGFGDVFPPIPPCLLGAGAAAAESSPGGGSMSQGMSQGRGAGARMAAKQASRAVRGEGFELYEQPAAVAEGPGNKPVVAAMGGSFGGAGEPSGGRGTFTGTVDDHLRAALAAAAGAGDLEGARAALDALSRVRAHVPPPPGDVVDLETERARRAR